ncbi:MAG: glycosyl transferase [Deltaproteobacteria bacterium]|nr:glycosyl transferase [Deltaproteobacteria bacterium]
MKIVQYCQHVLGMGHLFRTVELTRAFRRHQVVLVTGGPVVEIELPEQVRTCQLPELRMDPEFTRVYPGEAGRSLKEVKKERQRILMALMRSFNPDLFLVELYPFGRNSFKFELLPILEGIRSGELGPTRVVCSLRDILVEKQDQRAYEQRVLAVLNTYFDALLVHADPAVVTLAESFRSTEHIQIPVVYTGFVTARPEEHAGAKLRERLGIGAAETVLVASIGGGRVGAPLLHAVLDVYRELTGKKRMWLFMFTGPYMSELEFEQLQARAYTNVTVRRFTRLFLSYLDAADLSISMAGYNTCMNVVACGVPALLWPFEQNREQRFRVDKLSRLVDVEAVETLDVDWLAAAVARKLARGRPTRSGEIRIDGAVETALWLESRYDRVAGKDRE